MNLSPIDQENLDQIDALPRYTIGRHIKTHSVSMGIPDLEGVRIVFIGLTLNNEKEPTNCVKIRKSLYRLSFGNWNDEMADVGNIVNKGDDSEFIAAIKESLNFFLKRDIVCILIGGSQDLAYASYRSFEGIKQGVNMVCIGGKLNFINKDDLLPSHTYMAKIINESPTNLADYNNLGYQLYYNAHEEIDLIEKLSFGAIRLGDIKADISIVEPVLRNADFISIDLLTSVKASELDSFDEGLPNGFSSREACMLSRYSGISDDASVFAIHDIPDNIISSNIASQMIWYFIEGVNLREKESLSHGTFEKYTVTMSGEEIVFIKSIKTQRWWLQIYVNDLQLLVPCSHKNYDEANESKIPDAWVRYSKKYSSISN